MGIGSLSGGPVEETERGGGVEREVKELAESARRDAVEGQTQLEEIQRREGFLRIVVWGRSGVLRGRGGGEAGQ